MLKTISAIALLRSVYPQYNSDRLQAFFACRNVWVSDELVTDPQMKVKKDSEIEIRLDEKYVSRGGLKLEHAIETFNIPVEGKVFLDAGSSTGGFTDCLLQHGAKTVHSVDVGYNQLDYRLRKDPRVVVHERQNIMSLESVSPEADIAVADLSFRSISGAASHVLSLVKEKTLIALIKPQFEVPKWQAGFDGVIKDPQLLVEVLRSIRQTLDEDQVGIQEMTVSPIRGRKGNVEFLALLKPGVGISSEAFEETISLLVGKVHLQQES